MPVHLQATILLAWCYFEYQLLIVNAPTVFASGEKLSRLLHRLMILVSCISVVCVQWLGHSQQITLQFICCTALLWTSYVPVESVQLQCNYAGENREDNDLTQIVDHFLLLLYCNFVVICSLVFIWIGAGFYRLILIYFQACLTTGYVFCLESDKIKISA